MLNRKPPLSPINQKVAGKGSARRRAKETMHIKVMQKLRKPGHFALSKMTPDKYAKLVDTIVKNKQNGDHPLKGITDLSVQQLKEARASFPQPPASPAWPPASPLKPLNSKFFQEQMTKALTVDAVGKYSQKFLNTLAYLHIEDSGDDILSIPLPTPPSPYTPKATGANDDRMMEYITEYLSQPKESVDHVEKLVAAYQAGNFPLDTDGEEAQLEALISAHQAEPVQISADDLKTALGEDKENGSSAFVTLSLLAI